MYTYVIDIYNKRNIYMYHIIGDIYISPLSLSIYIPLL